MYMITILIIIYLKGVSVIFMRGHSFVGLIPCGNAGRVWSRVLGCYRHGDGCFAAGSTLSSAVRPLDRAAGWSITQEWDCTIGC